MVRTLYRSAAAWTALGLLSGLVYREVTRVHGFAGRTQLAFAHTHALVLGTLVLLVALLLQLRLDLGRFRTGRAFVVVHNIGLAVTFVTLTVKGTLQVLGSPLVDPAAASAKAIAGISGTGHILLTVGFVLFFLALRKALPAEGSKVPVRETATP